ncbi:MAG TPA: hypothetical protein PKY30_25855, partial [Myxococcota bacterium]|nr:hypothetical protein [Myxococcota bacterium]
EDFYDTNGSLLYRRRTIANILTTDTSVSLPAGLLSTGSYYKIEVQAVLGIDIDADAFASATTVTTLNSTGPFTP